ncbi:hypothetical protein [Lactobacillus sp. B4007]|nr:hypothetical protein [Lactobacillus sp. B4007]
MVNEVAKIDSIIYNVTSKQQLTIE